MSLLIIMRHAEAVSASPGGDDYMRPLTAAGRAAAERAALRIRSEHGDPDLLLHSPALRTTQTARIIVTALAVPGLRLLAVPELYLARGQSLLQLLALPAHRAGRVLLVGHNPGVSELAQAMSSDAAQARHWLAPAEFLAVDYSAEQKQ